MALSHAGRSGVPRAITISHTPSGPDNLLADFTPAGPMSNFWRRENTAILMILIEVQADRVSAPRTYVVDVIRFFL